MESAEWYYAVNGQQVGPVAEDALRQLLLSRQVSYTDLVWREGMKDWQPAGTIAALATATVAPPTQQAANPASQPNPAAQPNPTAEPVPPAPGVVRIPQAALPYAPPGQDFHGLAVGAFVVSLVGIACAGVVLGPVAIVLAAVAMSSMNRTGNVRGKGLAVAGLVIGIVDFAKFFLFIAFALFRH